MTRNNNAKMTPKGRKNQIIQAGVTYSEKNGYVTLQFGAVADGLGISRALPFKYFKGLGDFRKSVMREALRTNNLNLIMQMMCMREKLVKKAPPEILKQAVDLLGEPYGLRN